MRDCTGDASDPEVAAARGDLWGVVELLGRRAGPSEFPWDVLDAFRYDSSMAGEIVAAAQRSPRGVTVRLGGVIAGPLDLGDGWDGVVVVTATVEGDVTVRTTNGGTLVLDRASVAGDLAVVDHGVLVDLRIVGTTTIAGDVAISGRSVVEGDVWLADAAVVAGHVRIVDASVERLVVVRDDATIGETIVLDDGRIAEDLIVVTKRSVGGILLCGASVIEGQLAGDGEQHHRYRHPAGPRRRGCPAR